MILAIEHRTLKRLERIRKRHPSPTTELIANRIQTLTAEGHTIRVVEKRELQTREDQIWADD